MTAEAWSVLIGFIGLLGAGVAGFVRHSERITRIETIISLFSEKAADILHSPHTPELDVLLDKYKARNYELSFAEWERLRQLCNTIAMAKEKPKGERTLAAWLETVSIHKLSPSRIRVTDNNRTKQ